MVDQAMSKVTDLEKFALEHIVRPYQNMKWGEGNQGKLPCSLDELATMLEADDDWSKCVLARIHGIGFTFPAYINHKLATLCRWTNPC